MYLYDKNLVLIQSMLKGSLSFSPNNTPEHPYAEWKSAPSLQERGTQKAFPALKSSTFFPAHRHHPKPSLPQEPSRAVLFQTSPTSCCLWYLQFSSSFTFHCESSKPGKPSSKKKARLQKTSKQRRFTVTTKLIIRRGPKSL